MSLKGDFGAHLVAYELMRRGWEVSLNQGMIAKNHREVQGYDILARKGEEIKKIEVKFIDSFLKTGTYRKHLRQRLTPAEVKRCDAVIIVIYGDNAHEFYIIPRKNFKEVFYSNNTIAIYNGKTPGKGKMSKFKITKSSSWDKFLLN